MDTKDAGLQMHEVLGSDLWKRVKQISTKAKSRQLAIAYVTDDLIGLSSGDTLIVNASDRTIATGGTDAKLLLRLYDTGVSIYNCKNLHSKIMLLDKWSVVGSANLSFNSQMKLLETAVLTDNQVVASGVASTIAQLITQSEKLNRDSISSLCLIPIERPQSSHQERGAKRNARISTIGNRTWILGLRYIETKPEEKAKIKIAEDKLSETHGASEEYDWVRFTPKNKFAREAKGGDLMIQAFRRKDSTIPDKVFLAAPILLVQRTKRWMRAYYRDNNIPSVSWAKFCQILKNMGYRKKLGAYSQVPLEPEFAEELSRQMLKVIKQKRRL